MPYDQQEGTPLCPLKTGFSFLLMMMILSSLNAPSPAQTTVTARKDDGFRLPLQAVYLKAKPRTAEEVRVSYQALVKTSDGIDRLEARILAQHTLLERDPRADFDLAKPLIIGETEKEWIVRFPPRFSLTRGRASYQLLVRIRKSDGEILQYQEEERR